MASSHLNPPPPQYFSLFFETTGQRRDEKSSLINDAFNFSVYSMLSLLLFSLTNLVLQSLSSFHRASCLLLLLSLPYFSPFLYMALIHSPHCPTATSASLSFFLPRKRGPYSGSLLHIGLSPESQYHFRGGREEEKTAQEEGNRGGKKKCHGQEVEGKRG